MGKNAFLLGMEGEQRCSCPEQPLTQQLVGSAGRQKRSICSLQDRKPSILLWQLVHNMKIHLSPEQTDHLLTFSDQFVLSPPLARAFLDIRFLMLKGRSSRWKLIFTIFPSPQIHWLQEQRVSYVRSNVELSYREGKEQHLRKVWNLLQINFKTKILPLPMPFHFSSSAEQQSFCQASSWLLQYLQHTPTKVCWLLMPKRMFSMWLKNVNVLLGWAWTYEIPVLQNRWDGLWAVLRMAFSRARSLAEPRACRAAHLPPKKGDVLHVGAQMVFPDGVQRARSGGRMTSRLVARYLYLLKIWFNFCRIFIYKKPYGAFFLLIQSQQKYPGWNCSESKSLLSLPSLYKLFVWCLQEETAAGTAEEIKVI